MKKNKLIEQIEYVISSKGTSKESIILLQRIKKELLKPNTQKQYLDIIIETLKIIGVFVKYLV